ncbi:MAG: hypothetical protein ACHQY1_02080 [Myxococcota bacterium]|jgi:hypothetical protein
MSVDDRIRRGLHEPPEPVDESLERALAHVMARGRRKRLVRRIAVAGVAAVLALILAATGPLLLRTDRDLVPADPSPTPSPSATAALPSALVGRFRAGFGHPGFEGLSDQWHLRIAPTGRFGVRGTLDGAEIAETGLIRLDPATSADPSPLILVDALVDGACRGMDGGTYSWGSDDRGVFITAVDEPCDDRAAIMTIAAHLWARTG